MTRILYIDVDSLRADHLGCYGYERATTPNIDAVAARGVGFTHCYASDVPCLPSRTALFTGRLGLTTGVCGHGGTAADPRPQGPHRLFKSHAAQTALGACLARAGIHPASISSFPARHSAYHVWQGFLEMRDPGDDGNETADEVFALARTWLEANAARDDWFLHVNLWDPHTPYRTPASYGEPFADAPAPAWPTAGVIAAQRSRYGMQDAVTPRGLGPPEVADPRGPATIDSTSALKAHIDAYDTGIHYADRHVGALLRLLEELGVADDTAVVISADHGENHGELNVYGDHQTADQCTANVPLIIAWPGVTDRRAGEAIDCLVYQLDLAATLVELAGGTCPDDWDARSLVPLITGAPGAAGRDELIISQGAWTAQRAIRWGAHLLIRTYHTGFGDYPPVLLFDVETDPHETRNLAARMPHVVADGLARLDDWRARGLARTGAPDPLDVVLREGGPFHAVQTYERLIATLECTGRTQHAAWLRQHGGRPRVDAFGDAR
jgi:choline-sulfatase